MPVSSSPWPQARHSRRDAAGDDRALKVAQFLSTVPDALPSEYTAELATAVERAAEAPCRPRRSSTWL